jgi:hypothetical protein
MTVCHSPAEALAAGQAEAATHPPLDQDTANDVAVILAPTRNETQAA